MKQTELFDIKGHVAFVTGAASGLGRAYAEVMAENGAKTVLTDIDAAGLEKVFETLKAAGCDVEQTVLDIGDADALRAAIDATAARHGRLDIMFANAGGSAGPGFELVPTGSIDETDLAAFDRSMQINLRATFLTISHGGRAHEATEERQHHCHHVDRRHAFGAAGRLWLRRRQGGDQQCGAACGGRPRAAQCARQCDRAGTVPDQHRRRGDLHREPEAVKKFTAMIPMGRIAQPDEIKGLALLLASPAGSFITGTVIPIDGGTTAK